MRQIEKLDKSQHEEFITKRLQGSQPLSDPITKNKLALFSRKPVKQSNIKSIHLSHLKNDCALFSRLYIACQTRDGSLDEFFMHENWAYPPSWSNYGSLCLKKKSDILFSLEECLKIFKDYVFLIFIPYVQRLFQNIKRVDIVWDT